MCAQVLGVRDVPAEPLSVSDAREWLRKTLGSDHAAVAANAILLASELITNAIRHSDSARPGGDGKVTIVVLEVGDGVRVEVLDAGSATKEPRVIDADPTATTGRGLMLLDFICEGKWGTYKDPTGRTVWFEVFPEERGASPHMCGSAP